MNEVPDIDRKGLREFGVVTGGVIALLFGLLLPWLFEFSYPTWPWMVFLILGSWGLIAPASLRPVYNMWMRFALLLSKVTTPLFLGIVFFTVFFPTALILKIFGKDPMQRKFDSTATSYRVSSPPAQANDLEKPF